MYDDATNLYYTLMALNVYYKLIGYGAVFPEENKAKKLSKF